MAAKIFSAGASISASWRICAMLWTSVPSRTTETGGEEMPKSRAERARGRGETPSKRALRGAQKTAREDPERGVTRRARKRVQGREHVPDPRYGGRPGEEKSKWRPPAELMSPRQKRIAKKKG